MEDTKWEQRTQALTHILTTPTTTPSLYSQYFISTQIPCYLNWDYPPLLCPKLHHSLFSIFLKRVFKQQGQSWRSKCPYQQPPPFILAKGVEQARWDKQGRREFVRERLARKRLQSEVHPLIPVMLPNLFLLSLLLWNPFPEDKF